MTKVRRQCPVCHTEVEDTGGFCLLGHRLIPASLEEGSMYELRTEVDQAFEDARVEVTAALSASRSISRPAPVTPPTVPSAIRSSAIPPPPPPPPTFRTEWPNTDGSPLDANDPITAFAPPPRMDWGPEGQFRFLKGLPRLRKPSHATA